MRIQTSALILAGSLLAASTLTQRGSGRRSQRGTPAGPVQQAIDANRDGRISAEELANASAALQKLDRNGDGELSRAELRPPRGMRRGAARSPRPFEKPTLAKDEGEKKILDVLADLNTKRRGNMNVPIEDGRMLRLLTEALQAKTVVEIGTSNGYSGIWFCLALRKTGGKLYTHEIDPRRAKLARANFAQAGVDGMVELILGDAHETVKEHQGPIDLLFLDADKAGYIDYLEKLIPKMRPGGLILAHNMNRRQADARFIKAITTDPALETLFFHMDGAGMAVTLKKY